MIPARRALTVVVVALIAFALLPSWEARAQPFSKGDRWTYRVIDTFQNVTMTGSTTTAFMGTGSVTVNGTIFPVYILDFNTTLTANTSGIHRELTVFDRAYYTMSSVDLVEDDYTSTLIVRNSTAIQSTQSVHNVTTIYPPGGYGAWPTSLTVGQTWAVTYPSSSTETVVVNGTPRTSSSFINNTIVYRYEGRESVTVPAGTYDCIVLNETTQDSIDTLWQSSVAGSQAKIVHQSKSGETTIWVLESYSYSRGVGQISVLYLAVGIGVAGVGILVVALLLLRQRRKRAQWSDGPTEADYTSGAPRDSSPPYR